MASRDLNYTRRTPLADHAFNWAISLVLLVIVGTLIDDDRSIWIAALGVVSILGYVVIVAGLQTVLGVDPATRTIRISESWFSLPYKRQSLPFDDIECVVASSAERDVEDTAAVRHSTVLNTRKTGDRDVTVYVSTNWEDNFERAKLWSIALSVPLFAQDDPGRDRIPTRDSPLVERESFAD